MKKLRNIIWRKARYKVENKMYDALGYESYSEIYYSVRFQIFQKIWNKINPSFCYFIQDKVIETINTHDKF